MTSTIITLSCASAVECNRSMQLVANSTAVSKPNVAIVFSRSLSIVFGTPITCNPFLASICAISIEPSPPMEMRASIPIDLNVEMISSVRSISVMDPSEFTIG